MNLNARTTCWIGLPDFGIGESAPWAPLAVLVDIGARQSAFMCGEESMSLVELVTYAITNSDSLNSDYVVVSGGCDDHL